MARSIVGNRATSSSDGRPIVRSIIASDDRSYYQSWSLMNDRTINRGVRRHVTRSVLASGNRLHDQSWHPATDRPSNRGMIVRLVVPPVAKPCDKSGQVASSRTTERGHTTSGTTNYCSGGSTSCMAKRATA